MLPGDCITHENFASIVGDLTLLYTLGVKLVLVHGARTQIENQLEKNEIESAFHHDLRITPESSLPEVLKAVGLTRIRIESAFSAGLPNSPMHHAKVRVRTGNFITAMPRGIIEGVDYQYTGKIRSVDAREISGVLDGGCIALLSPLGYSLTGEVFNLSFADVAVQTAIALEADKLIVFNDEGTIVDKGKRTKELTLLKCEKFLVREQNHPSNTYFSLRACQEACNGGVSRSHIVSYLEDGSLLKEIYTRDGTGTMVYRDSYESIRRAHISDVPGILRLIEPLEKSDILVKRSRERLENEISHFTVMEKDNLLIGCAGLYPISDSEAGELACVAIDTDYRKGGRAQKLLMHIERQAKKLKLHSLFALTTQTAHWFLEQGFVESDVDTLPCERQSLYNYQRKSKVFVKSL